MKTFTKLTFLLLLTLAEFAGLDVLGQSAMQPTDPLVTYSSSNPPAPQPNYGSPEWYKIRQWVRTRRFGNPSWADDYKAYIYKGAAFRLKFPKTYVPGANDGKKYPLIIMMHGRGETGPITDNEYQMYHGGQIHRNYVENGQFDGYVLFMQTIEWWGPSYYDALAEIIDYMAINNKLDRFRVTVHGLSAGAFGVWDMVTAYPKYIASALPMSAAGTYTESLKFTPIWRFNGGLDANPSPQTCIDVNNAFAAAGANFKATFYPTLGHDVWNSAYANADFIPFINKAYLSNPWPVTGRTEFCPGDPINVTIGVRAGLDEYQWRMDGVVLPRVNRNSIVVDNIGTYTCRVRVGSIWSDWSPIPVVIKRKTPTVSPTITISGLMSKVIPALDGNTGVTLSVPTGYTSYAWKRTGNATILGTDNTFNAQAPGSYQVKVTEQFGCSSEFSSPFAVVDANGPNKPDAAQHLIVSTLSTASLRLDWSDNPTPNYNETGFEIYQGTQPGGPYKLIAITAANVTSYIANGLNANTKYYYKVRAVNNTAAAATPSNEASSTTSADFQLPLTPGNLRITGTSNSSVSLAWDASTDDVGISQYQLYINGVKSYVIDSLTTIFTATGLQTGVSYTFIVKAKDVSGNLSAPSNQVTGQAIFTGLNYKYYTGAFTTLPNFNTLTPVTTGNMPNVAVVPRTQDDNFAFLWEGYIQITVPGTYYFRTNSDDGSRLYLGALNGTGSPYSFAGTPTVNNDGLHGQQDATSIALTLSVGIYPIAMTFFEAGGGEAMFVSWRTPSTGTNFVTVPNSAFTQGAVNLGSAPAAPFGLTANAVSYNKIVLNWGDLSNNETGFEIYRSKTQGGAYSVVGAVGANVTTFSDSALEANTAYYYQIRSVGQFGESVLVSNTTAGVEAQWGMNNNLNDGSGNSRNLTGVNTPGFDAADKMEGTHAVTLNGTSQSANIPASGSFLQNAYAQKTVSFWIKSADNTTANRFLLDIGGSDDGLALRIGASTLVAGIAGNGTLKSISSPFTSTTWTHIALVYNVNSLKLYVNGTQAAADDALGFTTLTTTSGTAKLGFADVSTGNVFSTASPVRFSGKMDNVLIYNKALSPADIARLAGSQSALLSFATTQALPAAPATPTGVLASATSPSSVSVTWNDVATTETGYQLYKSNNNNTNYILFATLPANTTSFTDNDLFANAIYYYKVKTIGEGGTSAFSNEDSAKTKNTAPAMNVIAARSARYGITTKMNISATDPDGDNLTFSSSNLPSFITITNNGDRTATLTLNPSAGNQGLFNINFTVNDGNGGTANTSFALTVSDNYDPTIDSIGNYTVDENSSVNIPLSGVDQNAGNTLTWSVTSLPNVFNITPVTNRTATLAFSPKFGTAGTYVVTAKVSDANGGFASRTFNVTVVEKDPNTLVYLRFQNTGAAPAPWNNITGATANNFKDAYNQNTTIGINFPIADYFHTIDWGTVTGNNTGIYPDIVLKDQLHIGQPWEQQPLSVVLTGLTPSRKYSLTFFGSINRSDYPETASTNFTVNGQTASLKIRYNIQNTVTLEDLTPAANGTLNIEIVKGGGAPLAFLSAIVIKATYDDGTVPAAPAGLTATSTPTGEVSLTWQDRSYNEGAFEMYRSTSENSGFVKINTNKINNNTTAYVDSTAAAFTTYYYKVRAINSVGPSAYSDVFVFSTGNRVPKLAPISNVAIRNNQTIGVNIVATDDASDHVTLTVDNLPSFASFTDNGNGTGVINVTPGLGNTGRYANIIVTATDNSNAQVNTSFELTITDNNVTAMYVSFSDGGYLAGAPWNNLASWPGAGVNIANIKDDAGLTTPVTVTLVDGFEGVSNYGARPGNGTTIYDEQATRGAYVLGATGTRTIRVSGLPAGKVYNFVFFNSTDYGTNANTVFTIGGKSVTLNAAYNANKTVQINGVTPASGVVNITVQKQAGADMAAINTLVIQGYASSLDLLSPSNLRISKIEKTKLTLQWEDRSFAETGFQIWRATSAQGSYTLITTTAADVNSYTDQNLTPNKKYYYLVRAVKGGPAYSAYTAVASATTYAHTMYVNFTSIDIAPFPWNNTEATPEEGHAFSGFTFDDNSYSSIGMEITQSFSEIQPLGMNTGNNSGFFPDDVIKKTYCVFPGTTGIFKLTGLNLGFTYDIVLFGSQSQIVTLDATSVYVINGKRYIHNSARNLGSGNVIAYRIVPDQNGEIYISVARESATSLGGYLCGIIVSGNLATDETEPAKPAGARVATQTTELGLSNTIADDDSEITEVTAYPNPFKDNVTLSLGAKKEDVVMVNVYSINGQLVYTKRFTNLNEGMNTVQLALGNVANSDIYFAHITYVNRKNGNKVIKLVRKP